MSSAVAIKSPESPVKPAGGRPRRALRLLELFPEQGQWTEADYFALPATHRIVELSEGRVVIPEMSTDSHQYTVGELFVVIRSFVRDRNLGQVRVAPLPIRLWPGKIREPDIVFMHRDHADRIGEEYWGVPDLVVEVISPRTPQSSGTESTDRRQKLWEYAQAGVAEYWLVHPTERSIEVYGLRGETYHLLGRWRMGEVARSEVLNGLEVAVEAVFGRSE